MLGRYNKMRKLYKWIVNANISQNNVKYYHMQGKHKKTMRTQKIQAKHGCRQNDYFGHQGDIKKRPFKRQADLMARQALRGVIFKQCGTTNAVVTRDARDAGEFSDENFYLLFGIVLVLIISHLCGHII